MLTFAVAFVAKSLKLMTALWAKLIALIMVFMLFEEKDDFHVYGIKMQ